MTIAAIYNPDGRSPFYHGAMNCTHGGIRIRENGKYRVNTQEFCEALGLRPCPREWCWDKKVPGYVVVDLEAVR